jgi:sec-independent protein translocase protein TatC
LWTAASYYSLITWMVLGVGMAFQFPLVLLILIYLGVLSVHQLVAFRRYSIVVFLCLCAAITPTTDPVTFIILTIPLSLLYELAIILGRRVQAVR